MPETNRGLKDAAEWDAVAQHVAIVSGPMCALEYGGRLADVRHICRVARPIAGKLHFLK
jgi:hypothetical protein